MQVLHPELTIAGLAKAWWKDKADVRFAELLLVFGGTLGPERDFAESDQLLPGVLLGNRKFKVHLFCSYK